MDERTTGALGTRVGGVEKIDRDDADGHDSSAGEGVGGLDPVDDEIRGGFGDLYVKVNVVLPTKLSDTERECLREIAERRKDEDVRSHLL